MKNFNLENLVRPNILKLKPYSSARDEYKGSTGVFLDANENPFGTLNRYPDPYQKEVKEKLSALKSIPVTQIFLGNGSDEVIDLVFRIFCTPGRDKALVFTPTYGMYEVSANINDTELLQLPLNSDFQIDKESILPFLTDENLKLIFICSPNNPTGNSIDNVDFILGKFNGIVFVDEAYIDFSTQKSWTEKLSQYPNLIISQTFSKARGLAAVRVGIAYSSPEIIALFNKTKPPYNVSQLNQEAALIALLDDKRYQSEIKTILGEKERLEKELLQLSVIKKIYPSDANFILVEVNDADGIYNNLVQQKIITRNRNSVIASCIRITIGTTEENNQLIAALKTYNL
ncbi:histidinol-phosphate transaminase [Elizabethkingia miricola]|jgi:histidinol-phosphate aminotransferase|uniref:Histidinol-phosphate aminotransferase n=1 Tax=Elizabethkingia miricola TaxID=172045 RepID=A0ABD4DP83_ELIMR|nr:MULTISPECIES: histidinol-phosphate transaminase [Elizabethkingia]KUY20300.1 histidinol phosphate aminotransferase [Elizabethkingia miricola]MCL1653520.1 histidinol-phosphate transaminase [Elizabethkingia miricola]OPC70127.1 histidinol-phosphate transaminase [Elizabethkingia miricola]OPC74059.1 histidinol-phosphate transaminase [Elizabethkingia miricola]QCO45520.1 histidinol-phosphate transaminase [Elizabethkingia sp. 2-6]